MNNITFDSTSLSEQLGLYDFFNVLIYGATFIGGISLLNEHICGFLWGNFDLKHGFGIILLIYISGLILQDLGSFVDRHITKLYTGMSRSLLKGKISETYETESTNIIIKNPVVLKEYRDMADQLWPTFVSLDDEERFENDFYNGYVFSICQYTVSVEGNDKKVEKLRALFSMAKTLMSCFFLLSFFALISWILDINMSIEICNNLGISTHGCEHCIDKFIILGAFLGAGFAFYYRAKRTMRNFLLILLGTYNALYQCKNSHDDSN